MSRRRDVAPVETPSLRAVRELREWLARHEHGGHVEFGGELGGPRPQETPEIRKVIDDGLAAHMARDVVRHFLGALELGRHLAWDERSTAIFSCAETAEINGRSVRRPPSLRFMFGEAVDVPCELPDIGKAPERWRQLAAACHDFYVECFRGSAIRGEDHDARDAAADAIVGLGRWPTPREVRDLVAAARAAAEGKARGGAHKLKRVTTRKGRG